LKNKILLICIAVASVLSSCFEDLDDNQNTASALDIQNFIYRGLNFFYLYKAETPELANDAFATQAALNDFLNDYDTPEDLFDYLTPPVDRFSFLTDDYVSLENALNGTTLNNGMEFGLVLYPSQNGNVFGYVRYVLQNSSAAIQGIERGIAFNTIDGQQLTETNFSDLLAPDTYTIGLATFDGTDITPTTEEITLVKTEITENPVQLAQTLMVEGQPIGYMHYTGFVRDFDTQLNNVFGQFQTDGITELILDLRYNGGGSVATAVDLAGMITGQFNGQVFYTEQWNADLQGEFASDGLFDNTISNGAAINSLGLNRLFVLTTARTASASELIINSLSPYIDVVQVGDFTTGKYQASFLLYDSDNFQRQGANINHTYAMLPLVFKTANKNGMTDFDDGLPPDVMLNEDFSNLGTLGDANEPLLAAALNIIFSAPQPATQANFTEQIGDSKMYSILDGVMIAETSFSKK